MKWAMKEGGDILYAISSYAAEWATADVAKFEKSDDKKGGATPPPHHGGMPGMPGMPDGEE